MMVQGLLAKLIEGFLFWSFLYKFMALEGKTVKQKVTKGKKYQHFEFQDMIVTYFRQTSEGTDF